MLAELACQPLKSGHVQATLEPREVCAGVLGHPLHICLGLALDLLLEGVHGRLVVLKNGRYDNVPIDVVTASSKVVDVDRHYNKDRLRPHYKSFEMKPLFIMTSE